MLLVYSIYGFILYLLIILEIKATIQLCDILIVVNKLKAESLAFCNENLKLSQGINLYMQHAYILHI